MTAIEQLDPLRAVSAGRYDDALVVVERETDTAVNHGAGPTLRASQGTDGRIWVRHRLDVHQLDDDLAEVLAAQLGPLVEDHEVFARAFTGIVLTSASIKGIDPIEAWQHFYRNSIARIRDERRGGYALIYRHALELLPRTSVLDLGCGFGFLALRLAALGSTATACDVDLGTVQLLQTVSKRLDATVSIVHNTGGPLPIAACSVDAVAMLHVLEHIDHAEGVALIAEAMRVARRRVVIAVPYEDRPTPLYGHIRRFEAADLRELGAQSGWHYDVHDHLGGWLVLDRLSPGHHRSTTRMSAPQEGELQ